MASRNFKFISPGVFLNEIDNTQLPSEPAAVGPLIVGTTRKGPAMRPIRVDSFSEFVDVFGEPTPGTDGTDVWRSGEPQAPTYAAYAAQAWLRNSPTVNVVRLLGTEHRSRTAATVGNEGMAGWKTSSSFTNEAARAPNNFQDGNATGGAYGLWVFPPSISSSTGYAAKAAGARTHSTGSLAAIWYMNGGSIGLSGSNACGTGSIDHAIGVLMQSDAGGVFQASIVNDDAAFMKQIRFSINEGDKNYIRKVFNTNPTLVNTNIVDGTATSSFWLGESFTNTFDIEATRNTSQDGVAIHGSPKYLGVIYPIHATDNTGATYDHGNRLVAFTDSSGNRRNSRTGWFISQNFGATGSYDAGNMQKLFRLHGRDNGTWCQNNLKVSISQIRSSTNGIDKYGTFSVEIRDIRDRDGAKNVLERFEFCNLNPDSENYVARKIGDVHTIFDTTKRIVRERGTWPNRSKYVRIEMNTEVDAGATNPENLPWGAWGPPRYNNLAWFNHPAGSHIDGPATTGLQTGSVWWQPGWHFDTVGGDYLDGERAQESAFIVGGTSRHTIIDLSASSPAHGGGFAGSAGTHANDYFQLISGCFGPTAGNDVRHGLAISSSLTFKFPELPMRTSGSIGGTNFKTAYYGVYTGKARDKDFATYHNDDIVDHLRVGASALVDAWDGDSGNAYLAPQYIFTLDDISASSHGSDPGVDTTLADDYVYVSGTHQAAGAGVGSGSSVTCQLNSSTYQTLLDKGVNKFTTVFHGGVDGLNITEQQPLRSGLLHNASTTPTEKNSYVFNTYNEAIDTIKDTESVECNLVSIPGLAHEPLTGKLIDVAETRGDTLAVIDLKGDFEPSFEGADSDNLGKAVFRTSPDTAINNLKDRQLNSSYGCAYYPWVKIRDTLRGSFLFAPPSVVAIGAMSYTDRVKAPWFAPAGFNRGGLSSGIAGLPVVAVTQRLTSGDRDDLYDANINPIATFPNEGIVIFGQKTLQVTRSALDRINVRRLLIFVKKGISAISNDLLFEQNVRETWERFINRANPFLNDVKARFGLTDYKLILDETTTTPDLADRNIMYAKIFLKPARAIEFIAVDFIITNTGAAFED
tara:strand:- start:14085 stop:17345 length:3261 start_codon:yes stop_codon:yes gene_type:complete